MCATHAQTRSASSLNFVFVFCQDGADPPPRGRAELNADPEFRTSPADIGAAAFYQRRTRRELETESAVAAAAEAEAAAAESARREELQRREEREQRLRVTEMLYELKQDAEIQGQDLRRHLNQAQTRDPQGQSWYHSSLISCAICSAIKIYAKKKLPKSFE